MKTSPFPLRISYPRIFFLVPIVTLAVLSVFVPYCIKEHTIYTTQYIYLAMIVVPLSSRLIVWVIDELGMTHSEFFDWLMTIIIVPIACVVSFCVSLVSLVCVILFPRTTYFMVWVTATVTIFMLGVIPTYDRDSFAKESPPYIVAANHTSFLDYFLIVLVMGYRNPWTIVYGTNLHKYPILRYFLKKRGIGVDRTSMESKSEASIAISEALVQGISVAIFPEGTRMRSWQLQKILMPFKNGAFNAAKDTKTKIIPVVFDLPGFFSWPDKPFPLCPQDVTITICNPVFVEEQSSIELKNIVHKKMENVLVNK